MIIFMFGIVLTLVLFIAMGFVRGEGMSWRVNKKQLLALVGVLVICLLYTSRRRSSSRDRSCTF